jgi:hypothetical protein
MFVMIVFRVLTKCITVLSGTALSGHPFGKTPENFLKISNENFLKIWQNLENFTVLLK